MFRKPTTRLEFRRHPGRYYSIDFSRFVTLCIFSFLSTVATAQVSGSVSLVSNYVYRGVSLSNNQAEPQVSVAYDNDSGWFGGLFASRIALPHNDSQVIGYAGYAHQVRSDLSWEAGLSDVTYPQNSGQNYAEAFVGLSSERLNGRIYYCPNYLGQSVHSVYGEINGNYPLTPSIHLMAHVGYLSLRADDGDSHDGNRSDRRVGLGTSWGDWNFQVAVTSLSKTGGSYYYPRVFQSYGGVVNISYGF